MNNTNGEFDNLSGHYAQGRLGFPEAVISQVIQQIGRVSPRVLDLGCGTGISTRQVARAGAVSVGLDPSLNMITEALHAPEANTSYAVGEAKSIPFGSNSFDAVTCFSSFHWFSNMEALSEMRRVLKPGGIIVVVNKQDTDSSIYHSLRDIINEHLIESFISPKRDYHPEIVLSSYGFSVQQKFFSEAEQVTLKSALNFAQSISRWNAVPTEQQARALRKISELCKSRLKNGYLERTIKLQVLIGRWRSTLEVVKSSNKK